MYLFLLCLFIPSFQRGFAIVPFVASRSLEGREGREGQEGYEGQEGSRCVFDFQTTVPMICALHISGTLATCIRRCTDSQFYFLIVMQC